MLHAHTAIPFPLFPFFSHGRVDKVMFGKQAIHRHSGNRAKKILTPRRHTSIERDAPAVYTLPRQAPRPARDSLRSSQRQMRSRLKFRSSRRAQFVRSTWDTSVKILAFGAQNITKEAILTQPSPTSFLVIQ